MRITLALATGAALVVLGTGGAAYAVVAEGSVNPTTSGNVLPIDDNHSPITTAGDDHGRSPEPGDDRAAALTTGTPTTVTTSDDHGRATEPGDDRGGAAPAATTAGTTTPGTTTDDHGRGRRGGVDDGAGHH